MKYASHYFFIAAGVALLTACGGGGDDKKNELTISTSPGSINPSNVAAVASEALSMTADSYSGPLFLDPTLVASGNIFGAISQGPTALSSGGNTSGNVSLQSKYVFNKFSNTISPQAIEACEGGGNVDAADDGSSIAFNNCSFFGMTINGSIVTSVNIDTYSNCPGEFDANVAINNFSFSGVDEDDGPFSFGFSGRVDMNLKRSDSNANGSCESQSITTSMNNFALNASGGGESFSIVIPNYSTTASINEDTGAYSYSVSATIPVMAAQGTVVVTTVEPITGNIDDEYPSSGQLTISASGSTITVIINSSSKFDPNAVTVIYNGVSTNYSWFDIEYGDM